MTNRPIPRRGLLGCWFLTDRGITYDAGANEAIDRSGRGNHATYQNGVTVGVAGDPSREFGAADFDEASTQYADVDRDGNAPSSVVVTAIFKSESASRDFVVTKESGSNDDFGWNLSVNTDKNGVRWSFNSNGSITSVESGRSAITVDEYVTVTASIDSGVASLYVDGILTASQSGVSFTNKDTNIRIGELNFAEGISPLDGEIAAVGQYDLTVPDAPEPSEIAERWDRLTDIPATR